MALTEDGLVYAWGEINEQAFLGTSHVGKEEEEEEEDRCRIAVALPKPVEALRGVRMGSIAAAVFRSYAVADTGELWAWGQNGSGLTTLLGHGEQTDCFLPKPTESLRGIKVDAVVGTGLHYALALADDGSVYTWGNECAAGACVLGLGVSVSDEEEDVPTPQRIPNLRVACWL
jgi:regulator of chromosome condensation